MKRYRPLIKIDEVATGQVWLGSEAINKGLCDFLKTSDEVLVDMVKSGATVLRVSHRMVQPGLIGWLKTKNEEMDPNSVRSNLFTIVGEFTREIWSRSSSRSSSSNGSRPSQPSLSYDDQVMMSDYYSVDELEEFDE